MALMCSFSWKVKENDGRIQGWKAPESCTRKFSHPLGSCEVKSKDWWLMCCKFCHKQAVGMSKEEILDLFCRFSCIFLHEPCAAETDHKQLVPVAKRNQHQFKIWGKRDFFFSGTNILLTAHQPSQRRRTRNYTKIGRKVPSDFHRRTKNSWNHEYSWGLKKKIIRIV